MEKYRRIFAWLCVVVLALSTLPLYVISVYNHPYYDDYGFSADVHKAWKATGSLNEVFRAAMESARDTRQTWQGTYTGTILSNLQPGLFDEGLYWVANMFLITALIICFGFFFCTVFKVFGLERWDRITLSSLALTVIIQFMPDVGEAFYWFNGGVGNVFIYSLLVLAAALGVRLAQTKGPSVLLTIVLAVLMVLLGGGSYGGGLFGLCMAACLLVWLFVKKHGKRWHFVGLTALFAACFVYSMVAPGNAVRAEMINYHTSPVKTVILSMYYGVGQIGQYIRLPIIAVTLVLLPAFYAAARRSPFHFDHPWMVLVLMVCLYCVQLAPPLQSIASIGAGRIVNTYFLSFVVFWFLYVYYLCGWAARHLPVLEQPTPRQAGALLLTALCLLVAGCLSFKRPGDVLYGVQNMSGPSAALSIITGEAAQYDAEMAARETLLNDETQPVIQLSPLTANPAVFMDDLLEPGAVYDVRPSLCEYYGKDAILLEGERDVQ
ncbi:MAG: hypothetical protein IJ354_07015 [Clostridia bacterium]|nr:hypothetical protein [Clostridia bacterium]